MKPTVKRGRGRPEGVKYSISKLVRLDEMHADMLRTLAAREDDSESRVIRRLIAAASKKGKVA